MPEQSKIKFNAVLWSWWRFFWRFAVLQALLLFAGGYVINVVSRFFPNSGGIFLGSLGYGFGLNMLVSFMVFKYILGRKIGKDNRVLVPAGISASNKISFVRVWIIWVSYFWRFTIFAFLTGCSLMAIVLTVGVKLGGNQLVLAGYSKYVGLASVIPATFMVFVMLMWRKKSRRKLELIETI